MMFLKKILFRIKKKIKLIIGSCLHFKLVPSGLNIFLSLWKLKKRDNISTWLAVASIYISDAPSQHFIKQKSDFIWGRTVSLSTLLDKQSSRRLYNFCFHLYFKMNGFLEVPTQCAFSRIALNSCENCSEILTPSHELGACETDCQQGNISGSVSL